MIGEQIIREILAYYNELKIDHDVFVIADTQQQTVNECCSRIFHADESEFFSRQEFAEIASSLYYVFGFVRVFYSEVSFIEYVMNKNIDPQKSFVYNLSRDGQHAGKKSLIPAFCDLFNLKYTGCDAFTISLLRNKAMFSDILKLHNIKVPHSYIMSTINTKEFNIPLALSDKEIIVKNICESASIGLSIDCIVDLRKQPIEALVKQAKKVNPKQVLLQEYISGFECEVLVFQFKGKYFALNPILIDLPTGTNFIDSKTSNSYNYKFKLLQDKQIVLSLCAAAEKAAQILQIKDYARFDFRIKNGEPYLIDIAGTPYTIYHSSIAYLFKMYNLKYEDIYKAIVSCMFSNYDELSQ